MGTDDGRPQAAHEWSRTAPIGVLAALSGLVACLAGLPVAAAADSQAVTSVRLAGAVPGDLTGGAVAGIGDVNGDGVPDYAVSAPQASHNGELSSGSVYVVFGQPSPSALRLSRLGTAGFRIDGAHAGDFLGVSVGPAGDVNGDGIDDVVVGAPGASPNGRTKSGAAYVIFGSRALPDVVDLNALPPSAGLRIDGASAGDEVGVSVAGTGDVNGDGLDDLVLGAPGASYNARPRSGSAYVLLGRPGMAGELDLRSLIPALGTRIDGAQPGDATGLTVAGAGDIDGDHLADTAVGAPHASNNHRFDSGSTYVVYGARVPSSGLDLRSISPDAALRIDGAGRGDQEGYAVASLGDLDGNGSGDIALGAPHASVRQRLDAGAVYIVFGDLQRDPPLDLASFAAGREARIDGAATGDLAGLSLAAGAIDTDGPESLVIGSPRASPLGKSDAGATYVVDGTALRPSLYDLHDLDALPGFRIQGDNPGDYAGASVAALPATSALAAGILAGAPLAYGAAPASGSATVTYLQAPGQTSAERADLLRSASLRQEARASACKVRPGSVRGRAPHRATPRTAPSARGTVRPAYGLSSETLVELLPPPLARGVLRTGLVTARAECRGTSECLLRAVGYISGQGAAILSCLPATPVSPPSPIELAVPSSDMGRVARALRSRARPAAHISVSLVVYNVRVALTARPSRERLRLYP